MSARSSWASACVMAALAAGFGFAQSDRAAAGALSTFATPQAAADALIHAAQTDDSAALAALFGPGARRVLSSGDAARDKDERAQFARLAVANHHLEPDPMNAHRMILAVGAQDWPFPIPIVQRDGAWRFDPVSGEEEMHARRVGANELNAIEICAGYVEAQQAYAMRAPGPSGMHEYAQRLMSTPGHQDGLYWPPSGAMKPLVPKHFAEASADGPAASATPYHGYFFRILKAQGPEATQGARDYMVKNAMIGGFALVAWPAQYGVTGVHTFIVDQDGAVYERDLGVATASAARAIRRFNPDRGWQVVE